MKKILALDLGSNSIGWAMVQEAENSNEQSAIIKLGVRVSPLTVDETKNFENGKGITLTAERTLKRSMRRNLQRYKLRRENLIKILKQNGFINDETILSENGEKTTFETYRLRAKAVLEEISLEEFARVLLMINKKRGYKSSRKVKSKEDGVSIDGMEIANILYKENLTPGEFCLNLLKNGKKNLPDFYRSDLQVELDRIWEYQKTFYPELLNQECREEIAEKGKQDTSKIFLRKYKIYTAENKGKDKCMQAFQWRVEALTSKLTQEELAFVIAEVNGSIASSSGHLGKISDSSKEIYFQNLTVGQYSLQKLDENSHYSLKNKIFYRQDYLNEFTILWEKQAQFHPKELTESLKKEIRDNVIFYQRRLKSQKGLISFCEFESRQIEHDIQGKKKIITVGSRVCPRSSPLFQEFKIWQILNNIEVSCKNLKTIGIKSKKITSSSEEETERRFLYQEEKESLFKELSYKDSLTKEKVLTLLFTNPKDLDLNYKNIEGNKTQATLFKTYQWIIEQSGHHEYDFSKMDAEEILNIVESVFKGLNYDTDILHFDANLEGEAFHKQKKYLLWHLLYSFEDDISNTGVEKLIQKITELYGFEKEYAKKIANISFTDDYSSLSAKAIRKILPYLKEGNSFDIACVYAGYRHSKSALNKDELENKVLKDKLEILPKNTLRNPVVEKILNQMVNVVNTAMDAYGKPDEIRIELARELKKSAKERQEMTEAISKSTKEHEKYREKLCNDFGFSHISRNDIIRYKLYLELEPNGFKTLYSNTYIPEEKLFSKEFDIEHIIPKAKLFDDSFSNKTLELRSLNIEKSDLTAYDYVAGKGDEANLGQYLARVDSLYKLGKISKTKVKKLKMTEADIPSDFIERDLRDSQYIAKKAKSMLTDLVKEVVSTSGSITDRLREDWQLVNVMQELNWDKYQCLGLTEIIEGRDGQSIRRIKDWTKRNDHRHHAMDALAIAFTKPSHIQYLNNLNARSDKGSSIYRIQQEELYRDKTNKLRFKPPMPLDDFRAEAKKHLENILISIKAKNKVVTKNINITKKKEGINTQIQLSPRGRLHKETIYGSYEKYEVKKIDVNGLLTEEVIKKVAKKIYREALLKRLKQFENNPKKAFTGENAIENNPIYLDKLQTQKVPKKVKTLDSETIYTIRKPVDKDLNIEKVVNVKIKTILKDCLQANNNDPKKAFINLDKNPIWLNKDKGITIKRVTMFARVENVEVLHQKKDKNGKLVLGKNGKPQAVDFVLTGNNHHVAIYRDGEGKLQENVVSFFEAVVRVNESLPIIDKSYKQSEGWTFLFTLKQNEYFIFPNEKTAFNPNEIDLRNPENYHLISPNLFRVQSISSKDYMFNHHLETIAVNKDILKNKKMLANITYKRIASLALLENLVKVRINHIGQIVSVGEY